MFTAGTGVTFVGREAGVKKVTKITFDLG